MASELVVLIVTPLREYGRKLYKETGRRVKLEVTIEEELFDRLRMELPQFEPPRADRPPMLFFENSIQIVVACAEPKPLANQLAERDLRFREIGNKTPISATLDPGGRTVTVIDDLDALANGAPIRVVDAHSVAVVGGPLDGTCRLCGADLDVLRATGVTGHVCFGPGDSTNHRPPS